VGRIDRGLGDARTEVRRVINRQLALDAERSVLGAMMLGGAEKASQLLKGEDFCERRHELIFGHLVELWAAGLDVGPTSVLKRLSDRGELTRPETATYLANMLEVAAVPAQIGHFAQIVREEAERRWQMMLADRMARAAEIDDPEVRRSRISEVVDETRSASTSRERDSWEPIDLGPYLDGTHERPEPSVGLARKDGLQLLYPGKEHAVIGEMESGKSWFSLACVAAELIAGNRVVYVHFEEGDPADTVERLQALGCGRAQIRAGFLFVGPARPATTERIKRLLTYEPTLVILDGQNEGMALHAHAIREEDGAAAFRRLMVKPWTAAGATVLTCDHVVKDKESRGRYALGSVHKGNALSGSLIVLENSEPFGRGERGSSKVYITKDRPGHLRRHGEATKTPGKTFMGRLVVDDRRVWVDRLDLAFLAPAVDDTPDAEPESQLAKQVLDVIAAQPDRSVASVRSLGALLRKAKVSARTTAVGEAVEDLIADGLLVEVFGKRNARGFQVAEAPATVSQDQQELVA
jgi:hypothetical protein